MANEPVSKSLILASAITNIHIGAGRSPGIVDLPVIRDPYGYPYIPGSSFKGALKSHLGRLNGCIENGSIKCDGTAQCSNICSLLGPDSLETSEGGSLSGIMFTDLYPLFVPAPSPESGVVYITSKYLISRHLALLGQDEDFGKSSTCEEEVNVSVGYEQYHGCKIHSELYNKLSLSGKVAKLNPLYSMIPLEHENIFLVDEAFATLAIEKVMVRVSRIRLDKATKTVAEGGLWTEEYVPWGTLYSGLVVPTSINRKSPNVILQLKELINTDENSDVYHIIVGGKETIGKGLLNYVLT
ncbi:MAG: type III-B CRISPR module RAMP protein Cmr4 [Desulfurococcales archaeon]|nr:type III-B CRISPR module RAMP protein Cmr4 [Desulfurococcales archaeon]